MHEESLFAAALAMPTPSDRRAFLDSECSGDAALRRRLERLLAADERTCGILEGSAEPLRAPAPRPSLAPGRMFAGRFELIEKRGQGGMGEVWVAQQLEPVQRRVALKVLRPGLDSRRMVARFEQERQALARMDHAHIAKVLDAGVDDSGRSYFAMELIDGEPITQFCDGAKLSVRDRLDLFVPVCRAVQHAHQKGIIHRDLKPSNILVGNCDGQATAKVIDFGVAKSTAPLLREPNVETEIGTVIGTLEYMSPEQADPNNHDIDTRSDIYALGAVLYELVTGSVPFSRHSLQSVPFPEMVRMIREVEPPKPSARLSESDSQTGVAAARNTEQSRLLNQLRGELDWIVMKCLEKDRDRRYETANALARDIERHLADEPIEACPPSAAYRMRKFARRNWRTIAAATAFTLLLVTAVVALSAALVTANRERHDKEAALAAEGKRRKQAQEALDALTSQVVEDLMARQPVLTPGHKRFLESALRRYEEFVADTGQDEQSRVWLARATWGIALIRYRLDQRAAAAADWERSRELFAKLVADFPNVPGHREYLARVEYNLGICYVDTGRPVESAAALGRSLAISRELAAKFPAVPSGPRYAAQALNRLATHHLAAGRARDAEAAYNEALGLLDCLTATSAADPDDRYQLAATHLALGAMRASAGDRGEAVRSYQTSVAILTQMTIDGPAEPHHRDGLVRALNSLGVAHRVARQFSEARKALDQAVELGRQLTVEFPGVAKYRMGLGMALNNLGILHKNEGRDREAEAAYREALDVHKRLADDFPADPNYQNEAAGAMVNLARLLLAGNDYAGARRLLDDAVPYHRAALKANREHPAYRQYFRNNRWRLAETLLALNDHATAAEVTAQFLDAATDPPRDSYTAAKLLAGCVRLAAQDDRLAEGKRQELANAYGDRAVAALRQAVAKRAKEAAQMKSDPSLDPLRNRADFQSLLVSSGEPAAQAKVAYLLFCPLLALRAPIQNHQPTLTLAFCM